MPHFGHSIYTQHTYSAVYMYISQWSVRSCFTSEIAGSILSENFLNVTRTQNSTHVKRVSQHSAFVKIASLN